uniref:Uncharacterized protein n=1 Tax=Arundo donax TaxID=35708 RepID=A0A0A9H9K9_ARUDO
MRSNTLLAHGTLPDLAYIVMMVLLTETDCSCNDLIALQWICLP